VLQHEGNKTRNYSSGTNKAEEFARLIPKKTHDNGLMIVGEYLGQWALDNNIGILKTCTTCIMDVPEPLNNRPCDNWNIGYKSCWNCELLSEDKCPEGFWEFKDLIKDTDSLLEKIWICRNWQPSKKLFPIASDCLELEISSDA
jgi:hypothetical protein